MNPATIRRRMRNRIRRDHSFWKVWTMLEKNAEEAEKRAAEWEAKLQKEAEQRKKAAAEWEAKQLKEAEQRQEEAAEREAERKKAAAEWEAKLQKEAELWKKEAAERKKEADRQMQRIIDAHAETERVVKEVSRQMGGLHNSFGEMAEFMVAPGVVDLFNDIGYHITEDVTPNKKVRDDKKNIRAEIDLYMGNGDYVIAVEVKTSLGKDDIEHHQRRLEILREHINRTGDRRKIIGGMAVAVLDEADRKAVLDAGFYLLVPSGDMIKMDLPEGFVPREW